MSLLTPPKEVLEIAAKLRDNAFEVWCVGGAVRDALLGHSHLDWDLATSATPPQVMRLFKRTVPVGLAFGTVGVLDRHGRMHEVTTFRHDVKTDGRHAEVQFGASLDEDLARRDFTINAIAYDPQTGELRDPYRGRMHLGQGLICCVGDAEQRMKEDRLRALRALRFAARFGFAIDPATWKAICNSAPHLGRLSAERVKQEIEKTMEQVARPSAAFARWREAGALGALVKHLDEAPGERFAALDYLPMPGLAGRPQRKVLRLAMLLRRRWARGRSGAEDAEVIQCGHGVDRASRRRPRAAGRGGGRGDAAQGWCDGRRVAAVGGRRGAHRGGELVAAERGAVECAPRRRWSRAVGERGAPYAPPAGAHRLPRSDGDCRPAGGRRRPGGGGGATRARNRSYAEALARGGHR